MSRVYSQIKMIRVSKLITVLSLIGFAFLLFFSNPVRSLAAVTQNGNEYTIEGDCSRDIIQINSPGDYYINVVGDAEIDRIYAYNGGTSVHIVGSGDNASLDFWDIYCNDISISNCTINVDSYNEIIVDDLEIFNSTINISGVDRGVPWNSISADNARIVDSVVTIAEGQDSVCGLLMGSADATSLSIENSQVTISSACSDTSVATVEAPFATLSMSGNSTLILINKTGGPAIIIGSISDSVQIVTPQGGVAKNYAYNPYDPQRIAQSIFTDDTATTHASMAVLITANRSVGNSADPQYEAPPHIHSYIWETVKEPTEKEDGLEVYKCTGCGDIKAKNVLSAQTVFEAEIIKKIEKCPLNGTVYVETTPWNSFGWAIRDAMKKRPDVTIKASFLSEGYKGTPLKVTIPAARTDLFDNNGYLGLCRAGTTLGYDQ